MILETYSTSNQVCTAKPSRLYSPYRKFAHVIHSAPRPNSRKDLRRVTVSRINSFISLSAYWSVPPIRLEYTTMPRLLPTVNTLRLEFLATKVPSMISVAFAIATSLQEAEEGTKISPCFMTFCATCPSLLGIPVANLSMQLRTNDVIMGRGASWVPRFVFPLLSRNRNEISAITLGMRNFPRISTRLGHSCQHGYTSVTLRISLSSLNTVW